MPRLKRRKPFDPATAHRNNDANAYGNAHDRRSQDLLRNAEVAAIEVDDPLGLDPGDRIVVLRSIRNDSLARLHSHHQIDEAQYRGGRAFQADWERAERGPQAVDPSREYVDGGQAREPVTEAQRRPCCGSIAWNVNSAPMARCWCMTCWCRASPWSR